MNTRAKTVPPPIPQPKKPVQKSKTRGQLDIESEIRHLKLRLHKLTMMSPLYGETYRKMYDLEKLYKVMYNEPAPEITPWMKSS